MSDHEKAAMHGKHATKIAEKILLKTSKFCEDSVSQIVGQDIVSQTSKTNRESNGPQDENGDAYFQTNQARDENRRSRGLSRGNSVGSLSAYSESKDKKSVSIRSHSDRSRAGGAKGNARQSSKSLERMYTFNLSTKDLHADQKKLNQPAGVPMSDIPLLQNKKKDESEPVAKKKHSLKGSFCKTFQVLEKTNIQEKSVLAMYPTLQQIKKMTVNEID